MANVLSHAITYYTVYESSSTATLTNQDTSLNCFSWATFTGNTCTFVSFSTTQTVNHISQNFDDIT